MATLKLAEGYDKFSLLCNETKLEGEDNTLVFMPRKEVSDCEIQNEVETYP